jgi:hypothetical protein
MHPLTQNLSGLKDEELNQKFADLQKRLTQCYRSGPASAIPQIQMLLADYQAEIGLRNSKAMDELNKKVKDAGFKSIIDIQ